MSSKPFDITKLAPPGAVKLVKNTVYDPSYASYVFNLRLLGATQAQIEAAFGVSASVIKRWREENREFAAALQQGGEYADAKVAHALYTRAIGYTKVIQKINGEEEVHYPPDANACLKWLACRRKGKDMDIWREKDGETNAETSMPDDIEVARKIAFLLAKSVQGDTIDVPSPNQKEPKS